jgi:hypothetical protein
MSATAQPQGLTGRMARNHLIGAANTDARHLDAG